MDSKKVAASIVQSADGKYAVLIHWGDGRRICGPAGAYATLEEAKAAGTRILSNSMKALQKVGIETHRPHEPASGLN